MVAAGDAARADSDDRHRQLSAAWVGRARLRAPRRAGRGRPRGAATGCGRDRSSGSGSCGARRRHPIVGELRAPRGLGVVEEFRLLREIAPPDQRLKASVPGAYTLAGRLIPTERYPDRHAVTEALVPLVRDELERVVAEGCEIVTVDEPS